MSFGAADSKTAQSTKMIMMIMIN